MAFWKIHFIRITCNEFNHLIVAIDKNDVNVSIVSHPSQVFHFENRQETSIDENDKWFNVIEINRRKIITKGG